MQPSTPNGLELPTPQEAPGQAGPAGQPAPHAGQGGPARRRGHAFYSMTSWVSGKSAIPLRRKLRRSKILVRFRGTSRLRKNLKRING
jgi:hypothetical protein